MKKRKSTVLKNPSNTDNNDYVNLSEDEIIEFPDIPEFDVFLEEKAKLTCAICKKSFSDKNCLKKHIQKIHDVEPGPLLQNNKDIKNKSAPFKCRVCETEFAYKRNLKRHLIKYHSQGLEDEEGGNCFCNVEGCKFRSFFINALRVHLSDEHKMPIDIENKVFSSRKDFDVWKEEEEKTNVCLFIKEAGKHTLINGDQRLIYQCHRSGHYSGHGFGKRSFRVKGTCKLGKRCTAGIELTLKAKGDIHEVVYYKTHIWHKPDVAHVNLSASERAYLANKLREGASIPSILESVKANKCEEGINFCKRIQLLKRKDLVNIENTFRLNNTERHIRKQHKKGQKIDRNKIKTNVDDYGEIVSWVIESPSNPSEYFTVKRLQSDKCLEHCGAICALCDVCLHVYSCTCHDYLLFGTMCQHIHCVSSCLCPLQKYKKQQTLKSSNDTALSKKKYKKMDNDTLHVGSILNDKSKQHVHDRGSEVINFMDENFQQQQCVQRLLEARLKLQEKLNFLQEVCSIKVDQLGEDSVLLLTKIVDSALQVINPPELHSQTIMAMTAISVPTSQTPAVYEHMQPSTMNSVIPNNGVLAIPVTTDALEDDQQHNSVKQENSPYMMAMPSSMDRKYEVPPQYCPAAARKKRKVEEVNTSATFYRSQVFDKRNGYDNTLQDNACSGDNYTNFDCNTMSWQVPSNNTSFAGKWWTS